MVYENSIMWIKVYRCHSMSMRTNGSMGARGSEFVTGITFLLTVSVNCIEARESSRAESKTRDYTRYSQFELEFN